MLFGEQVWWARHYAQLLVNKGQCKIQAVERGGQVGKGE
jgi:hypothetical protein